MIIGAHSIIYSKSPEADRAFLRDVLGLPHVDVGDGWLIFALPPAEVAIHPADESGVHELYLMAEDIHAVVEALATHGVACTRPRDLGWGVLTQVSLPGGGKLGIYEPRHERPKWQKSSGRPAPRPTWARSKTAMPTRGASRRTKG
jgi:hypothetical protein